MKIIGITGPTGAGKTTALHILAELGVCILDADAIYHELLSASPELKKELRERFGSAILDEFNELDRNAMGNLVFGCSAALADLNAITHSHVLVELSHRLEKAVRQRKAAAAIDAIALIESGASRLCDAVVAVLAPPEERIFRIMARDGIDEAYARKRVSAQQPDEFYRTNCNYILENNGRAGPEQFLAQARHLFIQLIND